MNLPQSPGLDTGGDGAYLRGVDADGNPDIAQAEASTAEPRGRRRPRSPQAQAQAIMTLRPYSEANSARGREIREARQQ